MQGPPTFENYSGGGIRLCQFPSLK